MSFCSFADGAAMFDATPIENLFIMEYMFDAPAPALKVYLYARMLALHPELEGTFADTAKALHMEEEEVYDSFDYWERRGLVRRLTDQPPTYAFQVMRGMSASADSVLGREMYANREFNSRLQKLFENYIIGPHEMRKAEGWRDILKFDQDAILRMVAYARGQSSRKNPKPASVFKRVDKLAEDWSRRGAHTLEDVERIIAEELGEADIAREALKKLGLSRQPTEAELSMVRQWINEWGYDREAILAACGETVSARNPSLGYLNAILENRRTDVQGDFRAAAEVLRALNPGMGTPAPDQVAQYRDLLQQGFTHEMIHLAAIQCRRINKNQFGDLEWRLNLWREEGLTTPEAVEAYTNHMAELSRQLREVYRQAGYEDRRPSYGDLKTFEGWKSTHPEALIRYAAECSRNKGGSMAYMEKLLTGWQAAGVVTLEQARASHEAHRQAASAAQAPAKPANPALDYAQREYRDEDFGDDFYFDYDKVYGSEGKDA